MRLLESFTLGKKFGLPELNEDSLVIMPDLGYAVIDGVTDRNGTRYGGMLSGRYASRTVRRTIEHFLLDLSLDQGRYRGPDELVGEFTRAISEGYAAHGALEKTRADSRVRAGCAVTLAFPLADQLEIVSVGDSGIRINGQEIIQDLKPLDDVTALLRRNAWHFFEHRGEGTAECDRLSGLVTWQGTRHQEAGSPTADADAISIIEARTLADCRVRIPQAPEWELLDLVHHGIANGQGEFQNDETRTLGYGVIDGFPVPSKFIVSKRYPLADIERIELFSDGYFTPGMEFGVASWEEAFLKVEAEDLHKIGDYMSTKGTTDAALTDDRTYLGVKLK